jgi:large subunit ribosomal protein L25
MTTAQMPTLKAQPRVATGKAEARRLRRTGVVPGIAYGKGLPSTPIAVAPRDVIGILRSELGRNSVIELQLDGGKKLLAMIRDFTYHPVSRELEHVDFVEVKLDRPVDVEVPLIALGKAKGVTLGGVLRQVYRTVPVRCLPDRIPAKLEIDVSHLELGDHVSTKELKLGDGVSVRLPAEQTLIAVVAPEKEVEEAPVAAAAVPGAVPGAAAPGAPAAGAAPGATGAAPVPGAAAPAAPGAKPEGGKEKKK